MDQLNLQLSKLLLAYQIGFELLLQWQIQKVDCQFGQFLEHCWLVDQKQLVQLRCFEEAFLHPHTPLLALSF